MTAIKQAKTKAIKLDFCSSDNVTAFGGMAIVARLGARLGLRSAIEALMPVRRGYTFGEVIASAVTGLLTGAQGTAATQVIREDGALLALSLAERAPEEATFWRALGDLGAEAPLAGLHEATLTVARRAVAASPRKSLMDPSGFIPVFLDGTLLEGSARREGTKCWKDEKKIGLLWTLGFVGPHPVLGELAKEKEGEQPAARRILAQLDEKILGPLNLRRDALVLMDSAHGNGPSLDAVEALSLHYIVGAMSLVRADTVLAEQPDWQWTATPRYDAARGVEESAACTASLMCEEWPAARTLIGRRWKKKGELLWNYASVLTNLTADEPRVAALMKKCGVGFAEAIWLLYNRKGACENHFKNLLTDLGLHHPPCQEWKRNAAFYGIGLLAGLLATALDVITAGGSARRTIRTLRRYIFATPARVTRHARTLTATILGLSAPWCASLALAFSKVARC